MQEDGDVIPRPGGERPQATSLRFQATKSTILQESIEQEEKQKARQSSDAPIEPASPRGTAVENESMAL